MKRIIRTFIKLINRKIFFNEVGIELISRFKPKITALDIGASGTPHPILLSLSKIIEMHLCEPDQRAQQITKDSFSKHGFNSIVFYEHFLGNGESSDFHFTSKQECSSLLEPNFHILKYFPHSERFKINKTLKIDTVKASDAFKKQTFDYIKIDTQGTEYEIIKSFEDLENTLVIESEAEFISIYKNQKLYHHLASELEARGFELIEMQPSKWSLIDNGHYGFERLGKNPEVFCNAIFINKKILPWNLDAKRVTLDEITKTILILSRYRQFNLSYSILNTSNSLGIINQDDFKELKREIFNFKYNRKIKMILSFLNSKLNSLDFDQQYL